MKRSWTVLVLVLLLAGLAPAAWAQGSVDAVPVPHGGAVEAPPGVPPEAILYFWDFEANDGGFAGTLDWEWGVYAWVGNTCDSSNYPPPSAYSGTHMWGTVLNTCYVNRGNNQGYDTCTNTNPADDSILSFNIDLTGVTAPVEMSWWEWYDLFSNWDWAEVYANGTRVFPHCEPSFVQPTAWVQQAVDLTPFAGGPVTIEFHMMASMVVNHAGWYIDDVLISTAQVIPFDAWKEAPATALPGEVIHYTIVVSAPITPGMYMSDTLPAGVEYADNLAFNAGYAWYDDVDNAVYWTSNVPRAAGPAPAPAAAPVQRTVPSGRVPDTASGVQPARPVLPTGSPRPLQDGGLLYLTSLDIGDTTFAVYDPAIDSWTTLTPYETGAQMAVSAAGDLYAYNHTAGTIDIYDPATDTWTAVMAAPPGSSGQQGNLEITNAGEFLYTEWNNTTLYYTSGGVWNTLALPFTGNAMGDYDPTADQYVVGEAWTTNAHMIDVHTWTITDFLSSVPNGENARFSVILDGRYYFEAGGSNIHSFDLSNPALPPFDHGVSPGWYNSAAGDRGNALIYSASLDGTQLNVFDPATNAITSLTGYGTSTWHSSLAFTGVAQPPQIVISFDVTVTAGCGEAIVNQGVAGMPGVMVPFTASTQVVGDPDIEVTPLALEAELCPDTTATQDLLICNVGVCSLYWRIMEQPVIVRTAGSAAAPRPVVYDPSTVADRAGGVEPAAPAAEGPAALWSHPEDVLWDNGPLVTHPGGCGGQDASRLQTGLGMNTLGFGHQFSLGYRMADDFEITDPAGWQIDTITFFAYQTGAPSDPSPITGVYYQIWDGPPDVPGSSVVFGDLTTNRLLSSTFSNIQRDSDTSPCADNRYIFADVASAGVTLPPGTYWLDWMTDGSLSSGPWAPPITILGQTTTGNALQYTGAWAAALDSGTSTQQGMPFVIEGTIAGEDVPWLSEDPSQGSIDPGMCQTVTVTFDATGMAPGDYLANLLIDSNDPDEPEVIVPVTMTVLAPVDLVSVTYVVADLQVSFDATATGSEPISYLWHFGDGITSTLEDPVHTYDAGGCYDVSLEASNACGTETWVEQICVCDPVHDADFTWDPQYPQVDEEVTFTGMAAGDQPITFTWDLGDGGTGSGMTVTHIYTAAGDYLVTMVVDNPCHEPQTVAYTVTVAACVRPYDVDFTWTPTSPFVGDTTHFTATVGGGTPPFFYTWEFGDGDGATGSATVSHIYATAGTFTVTLTVTNTCDTVVVEHPIVVQPPVVQYWYLYLPLIFNGFDAAP